MELPPGSKHASSMFITGTVYDYAVHSIDYRTAESAQSSWRHKVLSSGYYVQTSGKLTNASSCAINSFLYEYTQFYPYLVA